jgi:hypothetical protein
LERNCLEVLAAVSIIEASQHKYQDEYNTLSGQNCFDLTCNILLNLRFDHGRFGIKTGRLNIFKIEGKFNWKQISKVVYENPEMVVLIYEMNIINS